MKRYKDIVLKLTPQRHAILKFLEGNKTHPSADDIFKVVSKRFPTMSLATVYNTLLTLKNMGEILELTIDPDKKGLTQIPNPIIISCVLDVKR
ncbi:MAG: transcriptional repressor [Thermodesulfovibrionales bacterium]|nr:transcriptional repressor [Thermodesulfovibrionales bacterium]